MVEHSISSVKLTFEDPTNGGAAQLELASKRGQDIHYLHQDYLYWLEAHSEWARAIQVRTELK
jgi:hypothetical protein